MRELNKLNDLTNLFLIFADDEAKERHIMTMISATADLLKFRTLVKISFSNDNRRGKDCINRVIKIL